MASITGLTSDLHTTSIIPGLTHEMFTSPPGQTSSQTYEETSLAQVQVLDATVTPGLPTTGAEPLGYLLPSLLMLGLILALVVYARIRIHEDSKHRDLLR